MLANDFALSWQVYDQDYDHCNITKLLAISTTILAIVLVTFSTVTGSNKQWI